MPKNVRQVSSLVAIVCGAVLAAVWADATYTIASGSVQLNGNQRLVTSSEIDTTWRLTKEGWQDSAGWIAPDSFSPLRTLELLHPFVWAGIVLITVIATMIWASSEWEIARLFEKDRDRPE